MSEPQRFEVKLDRPFDLDVTIDSWIYPDIQPTPEIKQSGVFARCFRINDSLVSIRVLQLQKGSRPRLEIQWPAAYSGKEKTVVSLITWLLGFDVDTRTVLKTIRADPVIAHLAKPLKGLRPFSQPSFFEAIVKAILQQQVSYRSASQVTRRLVETYGPRCRLGGQTLYGFPSLAALSSLSEVELRACKVGYKAPYLLGLIRQLESGALRLEKLSSEASPVIIAALDALRGIGVWTAELAVLTGLRRLEVFPSGDLGIRAIISRLYLGGKPAQRPDVEAVAERWEKDAPMVQYFLMGAQVLGLV